MPDTNRLYVRSKANWGYFEGNIDTLLSSLCCKGIREHKLIEGLKRLQRKMGSNEEEDDEYENRYGVYRKGEPSLITTKALLLGTEVFFAQYLKKYGRIWSHTSEQWRKSVQNAK